MNKLVNTRESLNLTQIEAAKLLGVSRRTYQYYEAKKELDKQYDYLIDKLKAYMVLDEEYGYISTKQVIDIVKSIASKHKEIHAVYLFGSYARNEARMNSDIDLLVVDDPIGFKGASFYLELKEKLKKRIDITSYRQVSDPNFLKQILIDGIKIYG